MICQACGYSNPADGIKCQKCGAALNGAASHFEKFKKKFSAKYEFIRLLGSGGFAEVYLARDRMLEREVAIKILLGQYSQDAQMVERFLREAKLYAKLEHANIIPIYDTGISGDDVFIVMKYINGQSLKQRLEKNGRFPIRLVTPVIRGIATALQYIHERGIIHRDVKPANIIIEKESNHVYLADFGIARSDSSQTLTQSGMIIGTPHYLSPEQIRGKKVDHRSDIYSLGSTLYELITGQPPFLGETPMEILYQHVNESPKPLAGFATGIPPVIEAIITRCIAKDPGARFQSARDIIAALDADVEKSHTIARRHEEQAPRRQRRLLQFALPALILAGLGLVSYQLFFRRAADTTLDKTAIGQDAESRAASLTQGKDLRLEMPRLENKTTDGQFPVRMEQSSLPGGVGKSVTSVVARGKPAVIAKEEPPPTATPGAATPGVATAPGIVRFSAYPPYAAADVLLFGKKIGTTDQAFEEKYLPGEYPFVFTIPGFQTATVRVIVKPGETVSAHYIFPQFRELTIVCTPFARVFIDGQDLGDTPCHPKLTFGEHRLRLVKKGYQTKELDLSIDKSSSKTVSLIMSKEE